MDSLLRSTRASIKEFGAYPEKVESDYGLTELRQLSDNRLTILGNISPRDVLVQGTSKDVQVAVKQPLAEARDPSRLILS